MLGVGDHPRIAQRTSCPPGCSIEHRVDVAQLPCTGPGDLDRHAVVKVTSHWPTHRGNPDEIEALSHSKSNLHSLRRRVVTVVIGNEAHSFAKCYRDNP
jgi:hypothetical protein